MDMNGWATTDLVEPSKLLATQRLSQGWVHDPSSFAETIKKEAAFLGVEVGIYCQENLRVKLTEKGRSHPVEIF